MRPVNRTVDVCIGHHREAFAASQLPNLEHEVTYPAPGTRVQYSTVRVKFVQRALTKKTREKPETEKIRGQRRARRGVNNKDGGKVREHPRS